jgi:Tfp pilus assembly protein PilV
MNSTFSLKSSIALLVLGVAMLAAPKQQAKSILSSLSDYQTAIAASAVGAIASTMQYEIV